MRKQGVFKSVIEVTASNITTLAAGVLVGFLLPKMISVNDYGYYKTFTLYCTYIGLFSLGIIDGIVLKYGGYDYESLNRKLFRSYFKWYIIINIVFALLIGVVSFALLNDENRFIFCSIGIFLVLNNVTGYFQQISQITQRYREYSARKVIQSILNVLVLIILYVLYKKGTTFGYRPYLIAWIAINAALSIWYIITYKAIIFGESYALTETKKDIGELIKQGIPLLVSNLCATLILTLDRQFVNILFDNKTYAIYAFAYNMLSLVTVATSAIATVLYPTMMRSNTDKLQGNYRNLITLVLVFVFACVGLYFPLSIFVKWFLPKYVDSLIIFRIIFPGLAISSSVTVVMHNYYKVLGNNINYFKRSVIVLLISAIANLIAYVVFKSTVSISAASIITMLVWYIFAEDYFVKEFHYNRRRNFCYLILMLVLFYFTSFMLNDVLGMAVYILCFLTLSYILFKNIMTKAELKGLFNR